jgi:ParB-like chromosome segregation protein Spo0J
MPDTHKRKTILKEVAIALIWPNPENPRSYDDPEAVKELQTNMDAVGQRTPVKMVLLTEDEKAGITLNDGFIGSPTEPIQPDHRPQLGASAQVCPYQYKLLGGHLRRKAAINLGWETLDALILDLTPEEAELEMILDNRISELPWLDQYKIIERQVNKNPGVFQEVIAQRIKVDQSDVSRAMKALKYLNPASRELIYAARIRNGGSLDGGKTVTLAIVALEDPEKVENTLKVAFDLNLTEAHAKGLVKWVQAGNPPETYTGHKTPKQPKPKATPPADEVLAKVAEIAEQLGAAKTRGEDPTAIQSKLTAYLAEVKTAPAPQVPPTDDKADSSMESTHPSHAPQPEVSAQAPSWLWQSMVGIKFISQMRSKVKKGETLTTTEKMLVAGYKAWQFFAPARKEMGKLFKEMVKGFCESVKKALGKTAKSILDFVLPLIFIGLLIWAILAFFHFAVVSPLRWIENKIGSVFHHGDTAPEPTPVPAPVSAPPPVIPQTSISKGLGQPKHAPPLSGTGQHVASVSKPPVERQALSVPISHKKEIGASAQVYQPAVSFAPLASPAQTFSPQKPPGISSPAGTQYDLVTFETEIAAIPRNSIVKDYPLTPDETMPGDLAASRLQDLTNADKYTMKIGGGTQKIISITTTTTNLIINYKSTDPFSILDSAGPLNFFWEDVLYIHTDEISPQKPGTQDASVFYQLSLVVSGSKYALTIQCASVDDLKHLVSTMEYFIRSSRLGHDTALAGMPYPHQGLVLNNDRVVDKLWANSPADKAGLGLGDHIWSIGKVASEQQGRKDLETGLSTLPITLFTASPAEWERTLTAARVPGQSTGFRPRLRKVVISL